MANQVSRVVSLQLYTLLVLVSLYLMYDMLVYKSLIRIFIKYFSLHIPISVFLVVLSVKLIKSVNKKNNLLGILGIIMVGILLVGPIIF